MAWVTPSTVATGDVLTAATWNQDVQANAVELAPLFAAWTTYTPTVTQNATLTMTNTYTRYLKVGRLVIWHFRLSYSSGTGSAGSDVKLTLPFAHGVTSTNLSVGTGWIFDNSANRSYHGHWLTLDSGTTFGLTTDETAQNRWGTTPSAAFTTSDAIYGNVIYEAAS